MSATHSLPALLCLAVAACHSTTVAGSGVEVEYIAHACFRLHSPGGETVLIDPFANRVWIGYDFPAEITADAVLVTHPHYDHDGGERIGRTPPWQSWSEPPVVYREPGEHVLGDFAVRGIEGKHADPYGKEFGQLNTIWRIEVGGLSLAHVGDNGPLTDEVAAAVGPVDVLFVPMDSTEHILKHGEVRALRDALRPKVVVPMHYRHDDLEVDGKPDDLGPIEPVLEAEPRVRRLATSRVRFTPQGLPAEEEVVVFPHSPLVVRP